MLMGEYQHNMDLKGRVTIPSKFREDLGDKFYVTKGLDGCLFVLSPAQWEIMSRRIADLTMSQSKKVQRFFFSGAAEVEPDKQGRILIPQKLREYAGLEKDVTVIGTSNRAEIWDTDRWNAYQDAEEAEGGIDAALESLNF